MSDKERARNMPTEGDMPTKVELEEYLEQLMRPAVREGLFTTLVGESGRRTWAKTAKYTAERFDACLKRVPAEHPPHPPTEDRS